MKGSVKNEKNVVGRIVCMDNLVVKLTDRCNGKCSFCIARDGRRSYSELNGPQMVKRIWGLGARNVLLLGGEPTLHPQFDLICEGLYDCKVKTFVTTNGYALFKFNRSLAKTLTGVNISLLSSDMDRHLDLTGVSICEKELASAIRNLRNEDVNVRINSMLLTNGISTYTQARRMAAYARQLGANEIRFSEVANHPELFVDVREIFSGEDFMTGIKTSVRKAKECRITGPVLYPDGYHSEEGWI